MKGWRDESARYKFRAFRPKRTFVLKKGVDTLPHKKRRQASYPGMRLSVKAIVWEVSHLC